MYIRQACPVCPQNTTEPQKRPISELKLGHTVCRGNPARAAVGGEQCALLTRTGYRQDP